MKTQEVTREIKTSLWKLFDRGSSPVTLPAQFGGIEAAAMEKQYNLWKEFRTRNPIAK